MNLSQYAQEHELTAFIFHIFIKYRIHLDWDENIIRDAHKDFHLYV